MRLYHTGYLEIPEPDIHYGRKNADFGQGFYLTADQAFAEKWAQEKKGAQVYVNRYELDTDGLAVKEFERDCQWFDYMFSNRAGRRDALPQYDVIMGPIANDTLYNTFGIITSGLLPREEAGALLRIVPLYRQIVLKTEKAAARLRWLGARILTGEEIAASRERVKREEKEYQRLFAQKMEQMEKENEP